MDATLPLLLRAVQPGTIVMTELLSAGADRRPRVLTQPWRSLSQTQAAQMDVGSESSPSPESHRSRSLGFVLSRSRYKSVLLFLCREPRVLDVVGLALFPLFFSLFLLVRSSVSFFFSLESSSCLYTPL